MSKVFEIAFKLGGELTSSFKSAFSEANSTMKLLGTAAAALGGTAVFANLATQVVEMSDSLNKLSAQTGTYGAELEALGDVAKNVFKTGYGESFDDVTEALMQVKNNMQNLDNNELERVTGNAMMLADTFDAEVNEVTRAANNLMTNFGIDSQKAFDLMAHGAQNGLNFSNEMFDNLSEYSSLFKTLGFSAEEYFQLLEKGSQAGIYNLDYLNDVVKEFGIRIKDGSDSTSEALARLFAPEDLDIFANKLITHGKNTEEYLELVSKVGEETASTLVKNLQSGGKGMEDSMVALQMIMGDYDEVMDGLYDGSLRGSEAMDMILRKIQAIDDPMERAQLGVALFGTKWEDLEETAMFSLIGVTGELDGLENAMDKINEVRFDSVGAAIKAIGRTLLVDLVLPIGDAALPYLNKLANYLTNNLDGVIDKTKSVLSAIAPVLVGVGAAFIAYQAVLTATTIKQTAFNFVQKITPKLLYAQRTAMLAYTFAGGGLKGMLVALRSAMSALNLTMLANPVGITIAAIIGLTAALAVTYKTSDRFRNIVNASFTVVRNVVVSTANFIATFAVGMWDSIVESAKTLPSKISTAISGSSIVIALSGLFSENSIVDGLINSIKTGFTSLPGIISMIAPTITTIGLAFLGVSGPVGVLIGGIVSIIGFLYRLSQTNDDVANGLSSVWQSISTAFAPVVDVLKQGIADFAAGVGPQLAQTMAVISESITALAPVFAQLGFAMVQSTTTTLPLLLQVFKTILPLILNVVSTVLPIVIGIIASIVPIIMQLAQIVLPLLLSVVQLIFPMILTIVQTVLPIVATLLTTVIGVILMLAQTVLPLVLSVVQMVFPLILTVVQTVIPIIASVLQALVTIINGVLVPAINGILAIVQYIFPLVQLIIQTALTIVNGLIQSAMALLRGDWDAAWNAILQTAQTIMNNIISFFSGINLYEVGRAIINGLIDGIKSMGSAIVTAISGLIPEPIRGAASKLLGALPGFAEGGVITSPTLAWVGEGGDTEAVIPWNNSQRSKDLWLQTGQALGMLNSNNLIQQQSADMAMPIDFMNVAAKTVTDPNVLNLQQQVLMHNQANKNATTTFEPADLASSVNNSNYNNSRSVVIELKYSPQYNVSNPSDLQQVKQYAETDIDVLLARLKEIENDEGRVSFD